MANGLLQSILGYNPVDLQQQRLKQFMSPIQQAQNPYERIGASLGTLLGGAFMSPDPALQRVSRIRDLQSRAAEFGAGDQVKALEFMRTEMMNDPDLREYAMNLDPLIEKAKPKRTLKTLGNQIIDTTNPDKPKVIYTAPDKPEDTFKMLKNYKENPEQAQFRLQELAQILEADPSNATALKEYEQVTKAASEGAMKKFAEQQKDSVDLELSTLRVKDYQEKLKDFLRLSPGERWDAEIQAARNLLKNYNIDNTKPLDGQVKPQILYSSVGSTITEAYERSLRKKIKEGGGPDTTSSSPKLTNAQDQEALEWANANPQDPRAAQIKQRLGVK
jgi:hypothetical protein